MEINQKKWNPAEESKAYLICPSGSNLNQANEKAPRTGLFFTFGGRASAKNSLQIVIGGAYGAEAELFVQHFQDIGVDKGREAWPYVNILNAQVQ